MKNIVLIGMMGCGKTTCANLLAKKLNCPVVDTDALIVEREGRPVSDIFAAEGEGYFRDLETAAAREVGQKSGLIIATGGGLPLRAENVAAPCAPNLRKAVTQNDHAAARHFVCLS